MGMTRRRFTGFLAGSAAALAASTWGLATRAFPWRRFPTVRGRLFVIPVKRLSAIDIRKPGHWRG